MRWDPVRYLEFATERGRPFDDLVGRIEVEQPGVVVDLGCGPGTLTRSLADRWPGAAVTGVDSSPEMIERALAGRVTDRLDFQVADLRDWAPDQPVDVIVCNATLQWVPDHLAVLSRLVDALRRGGWLAFQVPGNFGERSHTAMSELATSDRWSAAFAGRDRSRAAVGTPAAYLETLAGLGATADVWETTYLHVLQGQDAVVRWVTGTGLRPYLQALGSDTEREEFLADYRALISPAYPEHPWGTVLPFRRIFAVARRGES